MLLRVACGRHQWATPAAPCSSIRAPVTNRSRRERRDVGVRLVVGDRVREAGADARGRLEPSGAPPAVQVQALVGRAADDGRRVRADVDDAGPTAEQVGAGEHREQLHRGGHLPLDDVEGATLAVTVVGVDARAHHQLALVRLRHVHVDGVRHHDGRVHRLEELGHQRLQRVALQGQPQAEHVGEHRRGAAAHSATWPAAMSPRVVRTPVTRALPSSWLPSSGSR